LLLQEELRPRTLEDFIGNEKAIKSLHSYFNSDDDKTALLVSDPGLGKTTLAHCFAKEYNMDPLEINGSDEKTQKHILKVIQAHRNASISFDFEEPKEKLLIVDECEPIPQKSLQLLINQKGKKILICNEAHRIPYKIKQQCSQILLKIPTKFDLKYFVETRLDIPLLDESVLREFSSWRDCINWYYGGDIRNTKIQTELQEAREIFTVGPQHDNYAISPERLLQYYIHNDGDSAIASLLDMKMQESSLLRRVAFDALKAMKLAVINPIGYYSPSQKNRKGIRFLGFI